ncbi:methyltransferase [Agrobacterium salinitolerans]|nr:methyltransferase [Agrobacterium salinitolerans]
MNAFTARPDDAIWRAISTEEQLAAACQADGPLMPMLAPAVASGSDPLGDAFSRIRKPATRRLSGATYTPSDVVQAMAERCVSRYPDARRIVDCGAGSGRFSLALARAFPQAEIVAVERDPLACLILGANVEAAGLSARVTVVSGDFRELDLPPCDGQTLFVGNPPYVRHHDIDARHKDWLVTASRSLGFETNRLSGLHIHFFVKILQLAANGDAGLLITSSEWLDSAYGKGLRGMLAGPLGCTQVFAVDPRKQLFEDANVSSVVTEFEIGTSASDIAISLINDIAGLRDADVIRIDRSELAGRRSWSNPNDDDILADGMVRLGSYFSVHRGQVTGGNDTWIAGPDTPTLPDHCLTACVTKAVELISNTPAISDEANLKRVVTIPGDLDRLGPQDRGQVEAFLLWAKARGAADSYTARSRKPWWKLAFKDAAPILCTYMGRRPPAFVRNLAEVAHVNIAHGLYPKGQMTSETLDRVSRWLNENPVGTGGKTYGGGLRKFEPREIERIALPKTLFD